MINFKEVSEVGNSGNGDLYIYPGVREVEIVSWESGVSKEKSTPYIGVNLLTVAGKEKGDIAPKRFDFYFTEKTSSRSMACIKHILTKVIKESMLKDAYADYDEMAKHFTQITAGKQYRQLFTGEEYIYNNEVKEKATINRFPGDGSEKNPGFAEATQPNAEYPVVKPEDSVLKFDKNNQYDFKKLPKDADVNPSTVNTGAKVAW